MEKMEKKMARMHSHIKKAKKEIEWHERYFQLNEDERTQRDEFVESCLQETISGAEDSDTETVVSSRGGSIEGRQLSLSGEKHDTHPSEDREYKCRRDQGEKEK